MEITAGNSLNNLSKSLSSAANGRESSVNAFGIGNANKPEVELSAQARILQQNEQTQNERNQSAQMNSQSNQTEALSGTEFIRVSSSVGSAARNNLTTEKATEVYRSIQDLL
ncbi:MULTISPECIES: hypothetical protein [Alteromonadaceae]|uniref:hypothetical protein n=1 Tax=Alteromonadaceae TaxID=72275 RepID=UPI001C098F20|nr:MULTISPECIES: hypothetical protein [Aliiglaciecola]MBU2878695.1 hypothetical protein [Aliiglaciecola lipolytica]MDO6709476.1 hypothetical protein [Aliiglaciecola sp. 2_MG-2023]MDO6750982.1 hypothetical protein [Aliiglaciecola sp. 1_MG-2023]